MPVHIRILGHDEAAVLDNVADDVFDHAIHPRWCAEFFADPRHHLAVAARHHNLGIGRQLVATLVAHGESIGCDEAWVLTSPHNESAKRMYRAAGAIPHEELSVMFTYRMHPRRGDG